MRKWFWDALIGYAAGSMAFVLLIILIRSIIGKPYELVAGALFAGIVSLVIGYFQFVTRTKEEDFKELNIKMGEKLDKVIFDEHLKMDSEIIKSIKEILEDIKKQNDINENRIFEIWQHRNTTNYKINK